MFNACDPLNPIEVGFFDTFPANNNPSFNGAWSNYPFFPSGTVIVSDRSGGLFVLDVTKATSGGCGGCKADLDGDNVVGVKDLLILLGVWGPCPPKEDCPADFDDSGDVGVKDLLFLLGVWGPCP